MVIAFCVEHGSATYKQQFVLTYRGTTITTPTEDAYKNALEGQLSDVQTALRDLLTYNMGTKAPIVHLAQTVTFVITGDKVITELLLVNKSTSLF